MTVGLEITPPQKQNVWAPNFHQNVKNNSKIDPIFHL